MVTAMIVAGGILHYQDIFDWWRLRGYTPTAEIEEIAKHNTFTGDGKRLFYIAHPEITNDQKFNDKCRSDQTKEFSIILGCYITNDGIYIYRVTDPRLDGVIEVTAAHEMLHIAYERLSDDERARVDSLLVEAYENLDDERIRSTIDQYRKQDAKSVNNELHSILASEVSDLPAELESYYKQYFSRRQAVVEISEKYEASFNSLQSRATVIEKQLQSLKASVENGEKQVEAKNSALSDERTRLDQLRSSGRIDEYNSLVEGYNEGVVQYNLLVEKTRSDVDSYNELLQEYRQLNVQINDLYQSIDSRNLQKK